MKKILLSVISVCLFSIIVSCGGGGSNTDCDPGYIWDGSECVKDNDSNIPDKDNIMITDDDPDADATSDIENDNESEPDDDSGGYTGECTQIKAGETFAIDIKTKTVTIGTIKINGEEDDANLKGELWGENTTTLSEFKIADITADLKGKTYKFPVGKYNFAFRLISSDNKVNILEGIDIANDRTIDIDLPLYHFTGSVVKNGAAFAVDAGMESSTMIKLKSGTYEFTIPYADFGAFDLVVPAGKYSVYFEGQLSAGQSVFKGTVFSSENGIEITDSLNQQINVETVTYSGNAVNEGYDVSTGQLVLVENPPFDNVSAIIIPDLASKTYSVELTKGAQFAVLYLPSADSYPAKYIKVETFTDLSGNQSHDIALDFGKIYGTITFLSGTNLPSVSKCTEADCTRGKLKVVGFDYSSYVIKDFGTEGTDMTYEGYILRRTKTNDAENPYLPKTYSMSFESHLNNVAGSFTYSPFTMNLTFINNAGNPATQFNFLNADETYMTERQINFNIAPMIVDGTVKLDGTAITSEADDTIKVKDLNGIETPVINISDLTDGTFSFMVPKGEYEVIYEGEGILGTPFRTYINRNLDVNGNLSSQNFDLNTSKIFLGFSVDGKPFKEWAAANKDIESYGLVINPDKTAASYNIEIEAGTADPFGTMLAGNTVNVFLDIFFKSAHKNKHSFTRVPLISAYPLSSDKTVTDTDVMVKLTPFVTAVTLNGKAVSGATDHIAMFKISGSSKTEIYYPAAGTEVKGIFKSGEHKTPRPELNLNDGFDTKQSIELDCLYLGE